MMPVAGWAIASAARRDLRVGHVVLIGVVAALAHAESRARDWLRGLYPMVLVALLYDGLRPLKNLGLTAARVHVCDVRALDARLFGVTVAGVRMTWHDWFRIHHTLALDVACSIPYATFLLFCVAAAVWLCFVDRPAMHRFTWGFFALNVLGFATYHVVPAAPPWYFHAHGCSVDLSTPPSEGAALARVDALLGVGYFRAMYAKGSTVFGAIPSLHCAYPLLVLMQGWRAAGSKLRAAAVAYWLATVFAAVYLDHHWILDALVGCTYAAAVGFAVGFGRRPVESVTARRLGITEVAK